MTPTLRAAITAVGGYVPETKLTNFDLEKMVDTNDEWIKSRTGISERRILREPGKASSDMGTEAILEIIRKKKLDPLEIDCIICATVTPDMPFPSTANLMGDKVGAKNAFGFDLSAACSGFLFALSTGASFIETGRYKKVIVVGVDKMSSIIDYTDVMAKEHFAFQDGQPVFKFAVKGMADVSAELMEKHKLTGDDIAWLVPHQANLRIIDATANRMGLSTEKVMINIQKYGNTTAATIPLCLWDWEKQLNKGDNLILAAFGGGFTWGASWIKWAY